MVSFSGRLSLFLSRIAQGALESCFPRTCLSCGRLLRLPVEGFTCSLCRERYLLIKPPLCERCGRPFAGHWTGEATCRACRGRSPGFGQARALFRFRLTGARLVHCLKYGNGVWLVPEIRRLLEEDDNWQAYFDGAALVPVPLHRRKLRRRGYNQAELVAEAVARVVPSSTVHECLKRIRDTPSQTFLTRSARRHNVRGAFRALGPIDPGRRWILIDDVLTTGSTLEASARALRLAGAKSISAFTLARG